MTAIRAQRGSIFLLPFAVCRPSPLAPALLVHRCGGLATSISRPLTRAHHKHAGSPLNPLTPTPTLTQGAYSPRGASTCLYTLSSCPAGTAASGAAGQCIDCAAGSFALAGSSFCTACSAVRVQPCPSRSPPLQPPSPLTPTPAPPPIAFTIGYVQHWRRGLVRVNVSPRL